MVVILSVVWGFSACAVWVTPRIWSFEVCAGEIRFHSVSEKIFPFRMILEKTSSFSRALQTISCVCIGNYGHFLKGVHGFLLGNPAIFRQKLVYFCVRVRIFIPFRKPSGGGLVSHLLRISFWNEEFFSVYGQRILYFYVFMGRFSFMKCQNVFRTHCVRPAGPESSRLPRHNSFGRKESCSLSDTMNKLCPAHIR